MATALTWYSELQEPTINADVNVWGAILNSTNAAWDRALAGIVAVSVAAGDWTPTTTQAEQLVLKTTGVLVANRSVIIPNKNRRYLIWNTCTGAFTVTVKTTAGTGVVCPQGEFTFVYCDFSGTNITYKVGPTLGTAATANTGTSGNTLGFLDGNNTYSGTSTFTGAVTMSGGSGSPLTLQFSDDGATAGPTLNLTRVSTTPAASDLLGLINFRGRDSGGNDAIYGRIQSQILDPTDTTEDGKLVFYAMQAGTLAIAANLALGLFMPGTTDQGVGTINATALYQGGVALGTMATQAASAVAITGGTIAGITSLGVSGAAPFTVTYTDAGALVGPTDTLFRDSATPAASDLIGSLVYSGRDSAANVQTYASIGATITDPTSTSEDATLDLWTVAAGTLAARWHWGAGSYAEGVTGGDKGAGSFNATTIYQANVALATMAFQAASAVAITGGTISGLSAFTVVGGTSTPATISWADNGAGVGPALTLLRESTSPAAADIIGGLLLQGRDSAAGGINYGAIHGRIVDPTNGSTDGEVVFRTVVANTPAYRFAIGAGAYTETATGGDQGAGTFNGTAYYRNGVIQGVTPTLQTFTASGTWTRPAGCLKIKVTVIGGGGGAGGADSNGASSSGSGAGGGGGGWSIKYIDVSALASAGVTIGAAGSAGSTSGGNGGAGGTTSFGTGPLLQATGGGLGVGSGISSSTSGETAGGDGGVGSLGDANGSGQGGGAGFWRHGDFVIGGFGGSSMYGGGARQRNVGTGTVAGAAGGNYGAGGSGGVDGGSTSGVAGGAGAAGFVVVEEWY